VWIGDSGTGQVTLFDATGRQVRQFRVPMEPRQFDVPALENARDSRMRSAGTQVFSRVVAEAQYSLQHLPETAPLFTRFIPGADGEMWMEQYNEDPLAPISFVVVDEHGAGVARVTLPVGFAIQDVGRNYVLGIERDADDVSQVVEYALRRSSQSVASPLRSAVDPSVDLL